eukprot:4834654-Pleurochrysis_carterae.AAC.1
MRPGVHTFCERSDLDKFLASQQNFRKLSASDFCFITALPVVSSDDEEWSTADVLRSRDEESSHFDLDADDLQLFAASPGAAEADKGN